MKDQAATFFHRRLVLLSALLLLGTCVYASGQAAPNPAGSATAVEPANPLPAGLARGILEEEGDLNLRAAIKSYQQVVEQFDSQRRYAATALFRLGECYRKLGQTNEAQIEYQRILREFPDQTEIVRLCRDLVPAGHEAVASSESTPELERIKAISHQSPDLINAIGKDEETLLQAAAAKGQIEVVEYLLDHGAAVNGLKQPELTPLHFAAGNGRLAVVELLIHKGANVNAATESGVTPLHLAVQNGYEQVAKALLDAGADIHAAVRSSVRAERPDLRYRFDSPGARPLDIAVESGYATLLNLLIAHGADINGPTGSSGSPLRLAAGRGEAGVADALLRHGANINAKDPAGDTALHAAAAGGYLATVKVLIQAKADLNARNNAGETPLLAACRRTQWETAKALLAAGADPNLATTLRVSPLQFAVAAQDEVLTRDLLEHGANPNHEAGQSPRFNRFGGGGFGGGDFHWEPPATPLESACALPDVQIVKLLVDHGANPNIRNQDDVPLLENPRVINDPELLKLLLAHKADPNLENKAGETALHLVAQQGTTNGLTLLVEQGADLNARTASGATPLHYAVSANRLDMVEALIAAKADLNATDNQERTPLDLAKGQGAEVPTFARQNRVPIFPPTPGLSRTSELSARTPRLASPAEITTALRQAGALEEIPHPDRIEVARPSTGYSQTIFRKGTNDWNRFTLFELVADWYGLISTSQEWKMSPTYNGSFYWQQQQSGPNRYPDFAHITIRHPAAEGHKATARRIDLTGAFGARDCAKNVLLDWGDTVEIPEADHPVYEAWPGLAPSVLATLDKCLARNVEIIVKGHTNHLTLSLDMNVTTAGDITSLQPGTPFMLRPVLARSNRILASSDLSRVKVTRTDPASGQTQSWILNCLDASTAPDFWLRDGDRIDIPEKP